MDPEEIQQLIAALNRLTQSSGSNRTPNYQLVEDAEEATLDLRNAMNGAADTVGKFSMGLGSATKGLMKWTGMFAAAGVVSYAIASFKNLSDTMSDTINVGQTFGTDLTQLSMAAMDARMSLPDFADAVRENAGVISAMGKSGYKNFFDLNKQVVIASQEMGMYGYTTRELTGILGEQLEIRRLMGMMDKVDRMEQAQLFQTLQERTLDLASATGKARDQIIAQMNDSLKNNQVFYGFLNSLPEEMREQVLQAQSYAVQIFSALPGEAASTMNNILGESLALGSVRLTEGFKDLQNLAPEVASAFDQLSSSVRNGEDPTAYSMEVISALQNIGEDQMRNLAVWAQSGNGAAKQMLSLAQQAETVNLDILKEELSRQQTFNQSFNLFANWQQNVQTIFSSMREAAMAFIDPILSIFDAGTGKDPISKFAALVSNFVDDNQAAIHELGSAVAYFIKDIMGPLTESNLSETILQKISDWTDAITEFANNTQYTGKTLAERSINAFDSFLQQNDINTSYAEIKSTLAEFASTVWGIVESMKDIDLDDFKIGVELVNSVLMSLGYAITDSMANGILSSLVSDKQSEWAQRTLENSSLFADRIAEDRVSELTDRSLGLREYGLRDYLFKDEEQRTADVIDNRISDFIEEVKKDYKVSVAENTTIIKLLEKSNDLTDTSKKALQQLLVEGDRNKNSRAATGKGYN